jgi:hypothetical protein
MNLAHYTNQTALAIWNVFQREKLTISVGQCRQGPHTLTYGVMLHEATDAAIRKALKLEQAVETAIGDEPVRIEMRRGVLLVQVPSPQPAVVSGVKLRGKGLAVPVGVTALRKVKGIDFALEPHVLVVGPTRKGKTTAIRCITYHLMKQNRPADLRLIVSTFKPADWVGYEGLPHVSAVITSPEESGAMLRWLLSVVYQRSRDGQNSPHLVMVLDDLLNLLTFEDLSGTLTEIASLGAAAGVHLVIGTQRLGKRGAGDAAVTANMTTRLVLGTASAQDAAQYTGRGQTGAERLGRYKGDALLIQDGDITRVAVGLVRDSDLATLASGGAGGGNVPPVASARPWLSSVRTGAPVAAKGQNEPDGDDEDDVTTGAPVVFPLARRSPTKDEARAIAAEYGRQGSLNKTVLAVYGKKMTETMNWVKEALAMEEMTL